MKLALLLGPGENSYILYNYLKKHFEIQLVIVEEKKPFKQVLRYRIKKLGLLTAIGQILFQVYQVILSKITVSQRSKLREQFAFDAQPIGADHFEQVDSINGTRSLELVRKSQVDVIIVNGTRIIGKRLIQASPMMLNIHAGITPNYRGVHGGYWALVQKDLDKCGVTIHQIDVGVDTGPVFHQALITPTKDDNFLTYPLLQYAKALPLLKLTIEDIEHGKLCDLPIDKSQSQQFFHPTIWGYLWHRIP